MSQAERWDELAKLLSDVANTEYQQVSDLFSRLGDLYRIQFSQGEQAARYYAQTLLLDPTEENARSGLTTLIADNPDAAKPAVQALTKAYAATDDWRLALDLLEPRLVAAEDDSERARILLDTAKIQEKNALDALAASTANRFDSPVFRAMSPTNSISYFLDVEVSLRLFFRRRQTAIGLSENRSRNLSLYARLSIARLNQYKTGTFGG